MGQMNQLKESSSPKKREEDKKEAKPEPGMSHWGMPVVPSPHKKTKSQFSMFSAETNFDRLKSRSGTN